MEGQLVEAVSRAQQLESQAAELRAAATEGAAAAEALHGQLAEVSGARDTIAAELDATRNRVCLHSVSTAVLPLIRMTQQSQIPVQ